MVNKADLVAEVAERLKDTDPGARQYVEAVFDLIMSHVAAGERVQILGFGTFDRAEHAARVGRNPRTGAEIQVPAGVSPRFHAGQTFRAQVTDGSAATETSAAVADVPQKAAKKAVAKKAAVKKTVATKAVAKTAKPAPKKPANAAEQPAEAAAEKPAKTVADKPAKTAKKKTEKTEKSGKTAAKKATKPAEKRLAKEVKPVKTVKTVKDAKKPAKAGKAGKK